jgi:hypothetical protein
MPGIRVRPVSLCGLPTPWVKAHLIDADRFPPELDLVHDLARVFCVLFRQKLTETVALMGH